MARTVAALFDSRAEAEQARARLLSEAKARSPRIISKDTAGAVDGLKIAAADAQVYREGLKRGAHLVVAEVPTGVRADRIVEVLEQSVSEGEIPEDTSWGDGEQGVQVKLPDAPEPAAPMPAEAAAADLPEKKNEGPQEWPPRSPEEPVRAAATPEAPPSEVVEEERIPVVEEELRIGKRQVARGGARVRSFTRETPAEEQVSLQEEFIDVENRASGRQLSEQDVEAGGLFKERVFEIAEMREEPVVTKVAVVREEVIVRKRVSERAETIRDTVRHTEVEVEDLAASDEAPRFFRSRDH